MNILAGWYSVQNKNSPSITLWRSWIQSSRVQNFSSRLFDIHFSAKILTALTKKQDLPVLANCIELLCIYNSCWLQRALESTAGGGGFLHRNYLGEQVALGRALFNRALAPWPNEHFFAWTLSKRERAHISRASKSAARTRRSLKLIWGLSSPAVARSQLIK